MPSRAGKFLLPMKCTRLMLLQFPGTAAPRLRLMEAAGAVVVRAIVARFEPCAVAVLCGPGNNGGDGFVIARLLQAAHWPVDVFTWCSLTELRGDAAVMAARWKGGVQPLAELGAADLIVDALFGAGLSKEFPAALAERINAAHVPVVAVDVPSGLDGLTGEPRGSCLTADVTVTFFRKKPAHLLYPGRGYCGEIVVGQIGIPDEVATTLSIALWENGAPQLPSIPVAAYKFSRGAALVYSGSEFSSGAARLAAQAAVRIGAGVVSLCGPVETLRVHASHVTSIMLKPVLSPDDLLALLADRRLRSVCIGPAAGVVPLTRSLVETALQSKIAAVLDADALTVFADQPEQLFNLIKASSAQVVLTPHEGEFSRLFRQISNHSHNKVERARQAASLSGAVVLLKGPDTVIADPRGRAVVNTNGSAKLAVAGSGDVLAGLITGLTAQGLAPFEAACAGAWLHAEAAGHSPHRTIMAEDLLDALP